MAKHRVNLALPERTTSRLESLQKLTDASSVTEVVKSAILTYESIANHLANGVVFNATKPNGETFEVEFMIDVPVKKEVSHVSTVKPVPADIDLVPV